MSLFVSHRVSRSNTNWKKNPPPSKCNLIKTPCVSLLCRCRLQAAVGLRLPAPVRQQVRELHPLGGCREQSLPHHGPQRPGQALGQPQGKQTHTHTHTHTHTRQWAPGVPFTVSDEAAGGSVGRNIPPITVIPVTVCSCTNRYLFTSTMTPKMRWL